jgi:hypothetical protein
MMKMKLNTLFVVFTAALAGSALVLAEADKKPDRPKRPQGGKGRSPGAFLMQLDKDGDKAISKEEAGDKWERLSKLDKNGDGSIDENEIPKGPAGGGKGRPGGGGEFFKRADKNGDGKLSQDEVPEQAWERMSKADKDGDGAVTEEELKAAWEARGGGKGGPGKGGADFFARADKNGDGKLTKDEVPERAWERLSKADKDGDGAISKEELPKRPGGPGGKGATGPKGPKGKSDGPQKRRPEVEETDKEETSPDKA